MRIIYTHSKSYGEQMKTLAALPDNIKSLVYFIGEYPVIDSMHFAHHLKISHPEILHLIGSLSPTDKTENFMASEWFAKKIKYTTYHIKPEGITILLKKLNFEGLCDQ